MATPALEAVLGALRDPVFRAELAALPGYDPAQAGVTLPLVAAYPTLAHT